MYIAFTTNGYQKKGNNMQQRLQNIKDIDQAVANRLKARRKELGFSQKILALHLNISIQQIQKYEKLINRISSGKLYALSNLLDVPITYFFDDVESKAS